MPEKGYLNEPKLPSHRTLTLIAGFMICWIFTSFKIVVDVALETLQSVFAFVDILDTFPFPFPFDTSLIWALEIIHHVQLFLISATSLVRLRWILRYLFFFQL